METTITPGIRPNDPDLVARLDAFMEAFNAGTEPHPFMRMLRVWDKDVVFEVKPFYDKIMLDFIQTLEHGHGKGSKALDWFLDLAREHGVSVKGTVDRKGNDGLPTRELRAWYKRHGFHVNKQGTLIFPPPDNTPAKKRSPGI